ncbi:hypothetical protein [Spirochaeta cellobiosiphila]|uniref:hypothetical protein n=1 Tax=Spirochaeta cellobiosiphila TaxID=504483 RepID=UPI00040CB64B|nr:hypothetical protein [Spirochaeta cellobiosiphila]
MFGSQLKLIIKENALVFRLSKIMRIINGLICLSLIISAILLKDINAFIVIVIFITLLASLYNEYWTFDLSHNSFIHFYGLGIIGKKMIGNIESIESIELTSSVFHSIQTNKKKDIQPKGMCTLTINSMNIGSLDIEKRSLNQKKELVTWGELLSSKLNKPFINNN